MRRITVTIDRRDFEEIIREHLAAAFPDMEIENDTFPYVGDVTIRLRRKDIPPDPPIEPAPALEHPEAVSL